MRKHAILLVLVFLALTFPLGCRQTEPLAPEQPIVALLAPSNGATLAGGAVEVRIYVQHFSLVEPTGQPNRPGEGHAIYYLDVSPPLKLREPATTDTGTFAASAQNAYTWPAIRAGEHTFSVQLVNNDNTPLLPPTTVRAKVTVK